MHGVIERIRAFPAKGQAGIELIGGHLVKEQGLDGDYHAKGGDRQVSLLFTKNRQKIENSKAKGLCLTRFRENITIGGLDNAAAGTRIMIGDAVLEITEESKSCYKECSLYTRGENCPISSLNLFARVIQSGFINTGDRVSIAAEN